MGLCNAYASVKTKKKTFFVREPEFYDKFYTVKGVFQRTERHTQSTDKINCYNKYFNLKPCRLSRLTNDNPQVLHLFVLCSSIKSKYY